jgi:phage terminase large subunit-like protein
VQVPIVDVEDALRVAYKRWRVQIFVADPSGGAGSLQMLADEGLPVEEFPQSPARMTPATQRFGEVVEPGTHPFRGPGPGAARRQHRREE